MIFYVYMSPEVIRDANNGGPYAMDAFIGILLGFIQNCCIFEFEDNRMQKAVFKNVDQLPPSDAKKKIMSLLGQLKKQKRFICHLIPNYNEENINISDVNDQAKASHVILDFLLAGKNEFSNILWKVESAALDNYNQSNFERKRSNLASNGRILRDGELEQFDFMEEVFKKAFIHTTRIEICDRIFGEKFGDNFEYTFVTLFKWLEETIAEPDHFEEVVIHCGKPKGLMDKHMKTQLALAKKGKLSKLNIEIRFYHREESGRPLQALTHDRYLMTDQIALNIGRGMDFLSENTKRNRDISINYAKADEIKKSIKRFSEWMLEPVIV